MKTQNFVTTAMVRKYGKPVRKTRAELLFAELPKSPVKKSELLQPEPELEPPKSEPELESEPESVSEQSPGSSPEPKARLELSSEPENESEVETTDTSAQNSIHDVTQQLKSATLEERTSLVLVEDALDSTEIKPKRRSRESSEIQLPQQQHELTQQDESHLSEHETEYDSDDDLRILTWDDVCQEGDQIEKIAEASYAEVYRISNERGTSIIKVIRLQSPIKPQTKAQERSGLVDEEPHSEDDLRGELKISEWLADVPGFVIYKERYIVKGKAPRSLLETHQLFHRRMKRKDPDRLQFYPSPSRYLDDTRFLVVELGDAGTALEDFELTEVGQLWDIFLHTAIALARAEDLVRFEHRDLHEGNLCIRQARPARPRPAKDTSPVQFGYSGLEITILDYGLSRAEDPDADPTKAEIVAYDLEKDLSIFTSTHAPQCRVYRQMRSFLLRGDRIHLPPEHHTTPYELVSLVDPDTSTLDENEADQKGEPISWFPYSPYTNVLWLAYIYSYLIEHFKVGKDKQRAADLKAFKAETEELFAHLDPDSPPTILSFPSAADVVLYAAEAGWITQEQLMDDGYCDERSRFSVVARERSFVGSGGGGVTCSEKSIVGEASASTAATTVTATVVEKATAAVGALTISDSESDDEPIQRGRRGHRG